jgi:hypothetical protein
MSQMPAKQYHTKPREKQHHTKPRAKQQHTKPRAKQRAKQHATTPDIYINGKLHIFHSDGFKKYIKYITVINYLIYFPSIDSILMHISDHEEVQGIEYEYIISTLGEAKNMSINSVIDAQNSICEFSSTIFDKPILSKNINFISGAYKNKNKQEITLVYIVNDFEKRNITHNEYVFIKREQLCTYLPPEYFEYDDGALCIRYNNIIYKNYIEINNVYRNIDESESDLEYIKTIFDEMPDNFMLNDFIVIPKDVEIIFQTNSKN